MILTNMALNFKVTEPMEEYANKAFSFLEKHLEKNCLVNLSFIKRKRAFELSINFRYSNKKINLSIQEEDFYVGLDKLASKVRNKISKEHSIKKDINRTSINDLNSTLAYDLDNNLSSDIDEESKIGVISKRKPFQMKPMKEQEALLQIKKLGYKSFMFFDCDKQCMCLIYKRKDDTYGIIIPEV